MLNGFDAASRAPDAPTLGAEPVALSSLIGHGIRLQWYEAVAVVQEICEGRPGARTPEPTPDLQHTWICSDGRIAMSPEVTASESSVAQPVAALAQLLLSLIDEVGLPIQLELVVQAALSPTPPYQTAAEFSQALVRFERPNRALTLRDVYARWSGLSPEVRSAAVPPVPPPPRPSAKVVELPPAGDAMDLFLPERAPLSLHRFPIVPVAAAACVILAAAGVAAWGLPGGPLQPPSAPPAPAVFAEAGRSPTLVPEGWTTVGDAEGASNSLGLDIIPGQGLPDDSDSVRRARAPGWNSNPGGPGARPTLKAASEGTAEAGGVDTRSPLAAPPTANTTRATQPSVSAPPSMASPDRAVDERLTVPTSEPTGPVFSSTDENVVPPVLVQPKLSLEPPAGAERTDLSVFDVLVSDDGRVETIRLAGPARDYREAMILSAVKMWRFRPATKDGRPVRYLKRVWINISAMGTIIG